MTDTAETPPPAEPPKKIKRRRTWKQRIKLTLLVVLIAGVLIRLGLNFLLPTVVRKVANAYDLDCRYDKMSLNLFSGNAHIWNLELRPKSGGDSIVQADYIQGNISTPNLFRGRLVVYRAEVDGVDMLIDREPDGTIPLLKRFIAPPADAPVEVEPEPTKTAANEPVNLQAPLQIDAVRVSHVQTTFRDRSVTPQFETTVSTTLRISDVGNSAKPARILLQVEADPVLDTLVVEGELRNTPTSIDADVSLLLRGLHPKPAAPYLLPLGIKPIANDITLRGRAKVTANTVPNSADVAAQVAISDVSAVADTAEWASLKTLKIDAKKLNFSTAELAQVLIEAGRASARRSANGNLRVAGFELVPVVAAEVAPANAPSTPPQVAAAPAQPFRASLDELRLADLQLSFEDQAVTPTGEFAARLNEMTVSNIVFDPAKPDAAITLKGTASVPGVIGSVGWTGTAAPFAAAKSATVKLQADGIKPDALRQYLAAVNLESELLAGTFTADMQVNTATQPDGTVTTGAKLSNIRFGDGSSTLVALASADVKGLSVDTEGGTIRVASIDVTGPELPMRRYADGGLGMLGLRARGTKPGSTQPATRPLIEAAGTAVASTSKPSADAAPLPRVEIGRFSWKDVKLTFTDGVDTRDPMALQGIAGIEATNLVFDPAATAPTTRPGTFKAWLEAPGVAGRLAAEGTLSATPSGANLTAQVNGSKLTGEAVASVLETHGIAVTLKDGQLQAKANAAVAFRDGAIAVEAALDEISYSDGEQELAGVDAVRVTGLAMKPGEIRVGQIAVVKPRTRITRHRDGMFEAMGLRLLPPPPSSQPVLPQPVTTGPPAPLKLSPTPMALVLKQLKVEDAAIAFSDQAAATPLNTALRGSVNLTNLSLAAADGPAKLDVRGSIDGIVGQAAVTGSLSAAPDAPGAVLTITAERISGQLLTPYLPPGIASTLRDGRLRVKLDAGLANHPQGGLAGHLAVRELEFSEQAENVTLAKVGAFTVRAGRIDPAGEVIAVDEISSAGVELDIAKGADGAIDALGLRVGTPPPAAVPPAAAPATQPTAAPVVATTQPAIDTAALVADARRALPLLTVGKIDLNLERLRVRGLAGPDGKPVELARVRLFNAGPVELGGANADQRPPLKLQVDGAIEPVVGKFGVVLDASLFASEPTLVVQVDASGINGRGLTDILPELANTLNGEKLTDGTFTTRLEASVNYGRRGPRDLDLGRGFTAAFSVKPLAFRGQPDGPVLAGVDEVRGEAIRVQPRTGNVAIKSIEVMKPIGRFLRDEQGLHALGFVIPLQAAPATQPAEVAEAAPAAPPATQPVARAERPANETRLDRFTVSGIDLVFEDRSTETATIVPLKTLDLEVRDISNQMLWTGKPIRFDLLCTADKVPLPPRKGSTAGQATADGMEMRDLFSQITASGRIGMKQTDAGAILVGWAKTSVNGFELLGVRGLTEPHKVVIGNGVFDDSNDIRFKEDGAIETRNRVVFTNLSLTEPADGPIQSTLKLPAPVDLAIKAVADADGSITMDLPVSVESGAVEADKLLAPALAAVSKVVVTAIAAAPVKTIEGVGSLVGLGGKKDKPPEPPVELRFPAGAATLEPATTRALQQLADRMRRDRDLELQVRHVLCSADVAAASQRSNPAGGDVRDMAERLRRERGRLIADRAGVAAQTRAQFAAQSPSATATLEYLRAIDRQLVQTDQALDQLYELLRPGAASQSDRRTRAASLELARERLTLVQGAIESAGVPDAANRVRRTNPQFDPIDGDQGHVIITLVPKKK